MHNFKTPKKGMLQSRLSAMALAIMTLGNRTDVMNLADYWGATITTDTNEYIRIDFKKMIGTLIIKTDDIGQVTSVNIMTGDKPIESQNWLNRKNLPYVDKSEFSLDLENSFVISAKQKLAEIINKGGLSEVGSKIDRLRRVISVYCHEDFEIELGLESSNISVGQVVSKIEEEANLEIYGIVIMCD